jgi:hypothetical protein
MIAVYVPVFRFAIGYSVSFGRRWTALEHMLLLEMISERCSAVSLSEVAGVPERLIVEALINLLRTGWIEVRMAADGAYFKTTAVGARRASEETLPSVLLRRINWTSMCLERITGEWVRTDDLEIMHEDDIPDKSLIAAAVVNTCQFEDGVLRNLVYLGRDETFEAFESSMRAPSLLFAKVNVEFGEPLLPNYSSLGLREAIRNEASNATAHAPTTRAASATHRSGRAYDNLKAEDLIIGGDEHKNALLDALGRASSFVVVHSCFLHQATVTELVQSLIQCASRGVRVDLLWGLQSDPEDKDRSGKIAAARRVLELLPSHVRALVQLSPNSSGSHAKIVMFDTEDGSKIETIVGSCNFLSTEFDWVEMSLRTRSLQFARQVLSRLLAAQLPTSGSWPAVARRLEGHWKLVSHLTAGADETGSHSLALLIDDDHYACVTTARDESVSVIDMGCDLFGVSAETSALVPLTRAAERGARVNITYCRPTERLVSEGRQPDITELESRGLRIQQAAQLHAKYLLWNDDALAITSFNWLSTVVDGTRQRGSEVGVLIRGPSLRSWLSADLLMSTIGIRAIL